MRRINVTIIVGLLLLFCLYPLCVIAESTPAKVVLFPLDTKNAGKYAVLKDALGNMIAGRLASDPDVLLKENVLSAEQQALLITEYPKNAEKILQSANADYAGAGAIVTDGEKINLQMKFYSVTGDSPVIVEVEAENDAQIMGAVDLLLERIEVKVLGKKEEEADVVSPLADRVGTEAFRTEHPDRKYKEEIVSGVAVFSGGEASTISQNDILRRTSSLPTGIIGLVVTDGDGDGSREIFIVSERDLRVYRFERGLLKELSRFRLPADLIVHAMNIADINDDGKKEIFLSAISDEVFSSSILTWTPESGVTERIKDIRWGIRPMELPDIGMAIIGQRMGTVEESFVQPGLYRMALNGGEIKEMEQLSLPKTFNLFDFVYADLDGDGYKEKVAITSQMKLAVYSPENTLLWVSEKDYGGSVTYLGSRWRLKEGKPKSFLTNDDENYYDLQYIPTGLVVYDVNGDGRDDIIAAANILSTFSVFNNLRSFNGGNVVCLSWDAAKMTELWQTDVLDGYIAGIDFKSSNNGLDGFSQAEKISDTGKVQLVVGQIPSSGFSDIFSFMGDKARLIVYEFKILEESATQNTEN